MSSVMVFLGDNWKRKRIIHLQILWIIRIALINMLILMEI